MKFKIREEGNIRLSGFVRLVVVVVHVSFLPVNICLQLVQVTTNGSTVLIVVSNSKILLLLVQQLYWKNNLTWLLTLLWERVHLLCTTSPPQNWCADCPRSTDGPNHLYNTPVHSQSHWIDSADSFRTLIKAYKGHWIAVLFPNHHVDGIWSRAQWYWYNH